MQVVKLYDSGRRPPSWTDIIRRGQFVAFAKDLDTGGPRDDEGRRFAAPSDTTCVIFDSLEEARRVCEERTARYPSLQFDIFDSDGRANPPLLTIVSPLSAHRLEENPRAVERRKRLAVALSLGSLPLFAYQYWGDTEGVFVLPMFLGINMLIAAGRLFLMNIGIKDAERRRQERLATATDRDSTATDPDGSATDRHGSTQI